jgi:hypothetical protein
MANEDHGIGPDLLEVLQLAFELGNKAQEAADEWREKSVEAIAADISHKGSSDELGAVDKMLQEVALQKAKARQLQDNI